MLGKLFGKKKSEFYLELSEDDVAAVPEPPPAPAAAPVAAPKAVVQSEAPAAQPEVEKSKKKGEKVTAPATSAPAPSISDPVELIRTALAASANQPSATESESVPTFDYTTPVAKASRRRPGPSMSPFKTMAKNMKRTTAGF